MTDLNVLSFIGSVQDFEGIFSLAKDLTRGREDPKGEEKFILKLKEVACLPNSNDIKLFSSI